MQPVQNRLSLSSQEGVAATKHSDTKLTPTEAERCDCHTSTADASVGFTSIVQDDESDV